MINDRIGHEVQKILFCDSESGLVVKKSNPLFSDLAERLQTNPTFERVKTGGISEREALIDMKQRLKVKHFRPE